MRTKKITIICAVAAAAFVALAVAARLRALGHLESVPALKMAQRYAEAGENARAESEFLEAIRQSPGDVRAHDAYIISVAKSGRRGDIEKAWKYYGERYESDKESALNNYCWGLILSHFTGLTRLTDGYRMLKKAEQSNPEMPLAHYRVGRILLLFDKEKEKAEGARELREEMKINPAFPDSYEALFDYLRNSGRDEEARETALAGRRASGDGTLLAPEMAHLYFSQGKVVEGMRECFRAKLGGRWAMPALLLTLAAGVAWFSVLSRQGARSRWMALAALAFLLGVAAAPLAQAGYYAAERLLPLSPVNDMWNIFSQGLRVGLIEEVAKFAVIFLLVWKSRDVREVSDGVILSAAAGVGFAAIEGAIFTGGAGGLGAAAAGRFFAVAALNVFSSGIAGYFVAKERLHPSERPLTALAGLVIAACFHSAYEGAMFAGGMAANFAFVVVAGEMALFQYFYSAALEEERHRTAGADEGRAGWGEAAAALGAAGVALFGALCALFLGEFLDWRVVMRLTLLDGMRAAFLYAFYLILIFGVWRMARRPVKRIFVR